MTPPPQDDVLTWLLSISEATMTILPWHTKQGDTSRRLVYTNSQEIECCLKVQLPSATSSRDSGNRWDFNCGGFDQAKAPMHIVFNGKAPFVRPTSCIIHRILAGVVGQSIQAPPKGV